ncbi:MAG: 2-isopropylmalate synthase [Planctomycetota bacterium]|jgi:2-isopropylmalate synthase|nr:2-isopropylmalate synthase [Planctomycetota bacterium]
MSDLANNKTVKKPADVVQIFDTTLRDGEQAAGINLNVQEKVEIATQLARMRVDVIEAGFAAASPGDFACIEGVAKAVEGLTTVTSLARTLETDIRAAADSLKGAQHPRIHTFIATSDLHLEYKLKMTREKVLEQVRMAVPLARSLVPEVEFSAEDASRSNPDFLIQVFRAAVEGGATILNIPDTVGYAMPEEFSRFVKTIIDGVNAPPEVIYSVHAHNDLGLAVANSLAAVKAGVRQVECTMNGMGERGGNAAMEEIAMGIKTRRDYLGVTVNLDTTRLVAVSRQVSNLAGLPIPPNKPIVGSNAFAHEAGIHQHGVLANRATYEVMRAEDVGAEAAVMVLGKHSGRNGLKDLLIKLGYHTLTEEQIDRAFACFKRLCDAKKDVSQGDIEALVAVEVLSVSPESRYELTRLEYETHSVGVVALVTLSHHGQDISASAIGNGPINAACRAVQSAIGIDTRLETFGLAATSPETSTQGECRMSISYKGINASGRGLSTDVVEASVKAFINAVNNIYILAAAREIKINGE